MTQKRFPPLSPVASRYADILFPLPVPPANPIISGTFSRFAGVKVKVRAVMLRPLLSVWAIPQSFPVSWPRGLPFLLQSRRLLAASRRETSQPIEDSQRRNQDRVVESY